jgi:hypothetical protein
MNLRSQNFYLQVLFFAIITAISPMAQAATVTVTGRIVDSNGAGISNSTISMPGLDQNGLAQTFTTASDSNGDFTLDFDNADVPDTVALTVAKEGYIPSARSFNKGSGNSVSLGNIALELQGVDVLVLELVPDLHHLGDDSFGGAFNSQFQKSTEGTSFSRSFRPTSTQMTASNATITLLAKGLQASNSLSLGINLVGNLDTSPSDGSFGTITFSDIPISYFSSFGNTTLRISAASQFGDYDDFEFTNVIIRFNLTSSTPIVPNAPRDITASWRIHSGFSRVDWEPETDASSYTVYRCTESTTPTCLTVGEDITASSFDDTSGVPGTTYVYKVKACNLAGCSDFSENAQGSSRFIDDHGNEITSATSIEPDSITVGNIEESGDKDYFQLIVSTNGTLVTEITGGAGIDSDLLDSSGSLIESGHRSQEKIVTTGTYYLVVSGDARGTGAPYSVSSSFAPAPDDHGNDITSAAAVGLVSNTAGEIEIGIDEDYFKFLIPTDGVLVIESAGSFNTYGYLLDSSGNTLSEDDDSGSGNNFRISQSVSSGTYYIRVRADSSTTTGSYSLVVTFPEGARDDHGGDILSATAIAPNSTTNGIIEIEGDKDYFSFSLSSAGILELESTGLFVSGVLLDNAGNTLASDTNCCGSGFKMSPSVAAGTYYVRIVGVDQSFLGIGSTGSYSLVTTFTIDNDGHDILSATTVQATSTTAREFRGRADYVDYFKLSLPVSGTLVVQSTGSTETNGTLQDSLGNEIAYSNPSSSISASPIPTDGVNFVITQAVTAGTYYVAVRPSYGANTNDLVREYSFLSTFTPDAEQGYDTYTSIYGIEINQSADTLLSGAFDDASVIGVLGSGDAKFQNRYIDIYQFAIENDSLVNINLSSLDIDTVLYLVRIDSSQEPISVESANGNGLNSAMQTTLQTGTYWIAVSSADVLEAGAYQVNIASETTSTTRSFEILNSVYGIPVEVNPNPFIVGDLSQNDADIGDGSFVDLYQFTVAREVTLQIDMSSESFDTSLIVVRILVDQSVDNTAIFENNDFDTSPNSRITQTLSPGIYWIAANSSSTGSTGEYQISVTVVH